MLPGNALIKSVTILYILTTGILLLTKILTNDRPVLSSERAPHMDRIVTVKLKLTFDTKTD
jgi:hypothetical protein